VQNSNSNVKIKTIIIILHLVSFLLPNSIAVYKYCGYYDKFNLNNIYEIVTALYYSIFVFISGSFLGINNLSINNIFGVMGIIVGFFLLFICLKFHFKKGEIISKWLFLSVTLNIISSFLGYYILIFSQR
jgi:hypothetical protein